MIYRELTREQGRSRRLCEVHNGLRKKTLKDPRSSLKIVYYYRDAHADAYGKLTLFDTESVYMSHEQTDIDSAFFLVGLREARVYCLPGGQTHKEWANSTRTRRGSTAPAAASTVNSTGLLTMLPPLRRMLTS